MQSISLFTKTFLLSLSIITAAITQPSNAIEDISKPAGSCFMRVGWEPWEPYMYLTPGNEVSGLDIELIEAIAQEAGCILSYTQANWHSLLVMVQNGEVDIVPGASKSEARNKYALFSDSYREEHFAFYVNNEDLAAFPKTISGIINAKKKIGVTSGYMYGSELTTYQDDLKYAESFVESALGEANMYHLLEKSIDVFVEDPFVAVYNLQRKGLVGQIKQLPIDIHSGDVYLMFSKRTVMQPAVDRFNKALATIKQRKIYRKITERYQL